MALQDALNAEIARRASGQSRVGVFSIFNIGTGHTHAEINNTIAALGAACTGAKMVNDGPVGAMGNAQGWGMNDMLKNTMAKLKAVGLAGVTHVNMTGHSRGAILCHMLANAIFADPATRHLKINMIVLDPVHQSKMNHPGAESLPDSPSLLSYHAIIMENENKKVVGATAFPFKFVTGAAQTSRHYINMPGTHGSGSQNLTSAVGKVVYQLIAGFMRTRRTEFTSRVMTPLDMCDLFAQIHLQNPLSMDGVKRLIFDDLGHASVHSPKATELFQPKTETFQGNSTRAADVAKALKANLTSRRQPGAKVVPVMPQSPISSYIFNAEHAFYFKSCFPYFFRVLAGAPGKTPFDEGGFNRDFDRMGTSPALAGSFALLAAHMKPLLM
jgi:hypothetical protein